MGETAKASINNSNVFVFTLNIYLNYLISFYKLSLYKRAGLPAERRGSRRVTGLVPRGQGTGGEGLLRRRDQQLSNFIHIIYGVTALKVEYDQ